MKTGCVYKCILYVEPCSLSDYESVKQIDLIYNNKWLGSVLKLIGWFNELQYIRHMVAVTMEG